MLCNDQYYLLNANAKIYNFLIFLIVKFCYFLNYICIKYEICNNIKVASLIILIDFNVIFIIYLNIM